MASIRPTTIPDKRLAASIDASDSSFQLDDIKGWDGNNLTSSDFGSVAYAVFRDSQSSNIEIIEFDPTTIANSSITINKRGLQFDGDLTTEVSANKLTWIKGDTVVSLGTHVPQLLRHYVTTIEDQTIAGVKTFSDLPETSAGDPVDDEDLARKAYVDSTATGSATTNRVVVSGTAGATVAAGDALYLDTADGEWKKADGNTSATLYNVELGIAQGSGTDGNAISGGVLISGMDSNQTGFTAGDVIYISDTAGTLASSAGTNEKIVGVAKSATEIYFDPDFGPAPTSDEKDALAGTGTPNATNKYVTDDDVSDTAESGKVVRATGTALPALSGANLTNLPANTLKSQVFTSGGTWTKPASVSTVQVAVVGAGGGGGDGHSSGGTSGDEAAAGGGGAGGYAFAEVAVSGNVTVTVGSGGAGGSTDGQNGSAGGNSSFAGDVTVTANGGSGGSGADGTGVTGSGGAGGTNTNADADVTGGAGGAGFISGSNKGLGGTGGSTPLGDGGKGQTNGGGAGGVGFGSGGAGGSGFNSSGNGGAGQDGVVIVYWVE